METAKEYDVFISYSSKDQKIAEGICGYLESRKYRCFVAYRDIPKGKIWAAAIPYAIHTSSMMIVVFSDSFNISSQTDRELEIAAEDKLPILTFRISDTLFTGAKEFYLKNLNWIDAFPKPEEYFGQIYISVSRLVPKLQEPNSGNKKNGDETPENMAVRHSLKVKVDASCIFYIDGDEIAKLTSGKIEKFPLQRGEYELRFVSADNPANFIEMTFEMPDFDKFKNVHLKDVKVQQFNNNAEKSKGVDKSQEKKVKQSAIKNVKQKSEKCKFEKRKLVDGNTLVEVVNCPVCGSADIGLWNSRKQTYHCHNCDNYFNKAVLCPVCGSDNVGLYNSRKQTYHCHNCDHYFNKYGIV